MGCGPWGHTDSPQQGHCSHPISAGTRGPYHRPHLRQTRGPLLPAHAGGDGESQQGSGRCPSALAWSRPLELASARARSCRRAGSLGVSQPSKKGHRCRFSHLQGMNMNF